MGEYAKYNGEDIKIGTCDAMYYLRYEDRDQVEPQAHSLNPATALNLFWRLPFPDEDDCGPGGYDTHNRGYRLYKSTENGYSMDFEGADAADFPGTIQLRHNDSGLMVNIKCYHGVKLPEGSEDIKPFWNGKGWSLELAHIKNTPEGIKPVVHCRHCGKMWRYDWADIKDYLHGEMLERLSKYFPDEAGRKAA